MGGCALGGVIMTTSKRIVGHRPSDSSFKTIIYFYLVILNTHISPSTCGAMGTGTTNQEFVRRDICKPDSSKYVKKCANLN